MRFCPAGNNGMLVGGWALAGIIVVITGSMVLIHSGRGKLVRKSDLKKNETAANMYVDLKARSKPDDAEIQALARRKREAAALNAPLQRASTIQVPLEFYLQNPPTAQAEVADFGAALLRRVYSLPEGGEKNALLARLGAGLDSFAAAGAFGSGMHARETTAELYEWTGHPDKSLEIWKDELDRAPTQKAAANVRRLAEFLGDDASLADSMQVIFSSAAPSAADVEEIFNTADSTGRGSLEVPVEKYLQHNPRDAKTWNALIRRRIDKGELRKALALAKLRLKREGLTEAGSLMLSEIEWRMGHTSGALAAMRAYAASAGGQSADFLQSYGELAWQLEENRSAAYAYRKLWDTGHKEPLLAERLIILDREKGDFRAALGTAVEAWSISHQPRFYVYALEMAMLAGENGKFMELERKAPQGPGLDSNGYFWSLRAQARALAGDYNAAISDSLHALALSPGSGDIMGQALWLLSSSGDYAMLREKLALFSRQDSNDAQLEFALAQGWQMLGDTEQSLWWYARAYRQLYDQPVFLSSYADEMETAGWLPRALRLRARAVEILRRNPSDDGIGPRLRYVQLAYAHGARMAAARMLSGGDGVAVSTTALDSLALAGAQQGAQENESYLLRRKIGAYTPAWHKLALAMEENDIGAVSELLRDTAAVSGLDCATVSYAESMTGALRAAYERAAGCQPSNWEKQTFVSQISSLDEQLRSGVAVFFSGWQAGPLSAAGEGMRFQLAGDDWKAGAQASRLGLRSVSSSLSTDGVAGETEATLFWNSVHGDNVLKAEAGADDMDEYYTVPRGSLSYNFRMRRDLTGEAGMTVNGQGDDTTDLRLTGLRDDAHMTLNWDLTAREYFSATGGGHLYRERDGYQLAKGWYANAALGSRLLLSGPALSVYASGSAMGNTVNSPSTYLLRFFPEGVQGSDIVPASYSSAGIGLRAGDGQEELLYGHGMAWQAEAWAGFSWPSANAGFYARLGAALPVCDDIRFFADGTFSTSAYGPAAQQSKSLRAGLGRAF